MQSANAHAFDLDITIPVAGPADITSDFTAPRPLPVLLPRDPLNWLARLRQHIADWVSPRSYRELAALTAVGDSAVEHLVAERHWQAHCRDQTALRNWGRAQDALGEAAEKLLSARNGAQT